MYNYGLLILIVIDMLNGDRKEGGMELNSGRINLLKRASQVRSGGVAVGRTDGEGEA